MLRGGVNCIVAVGRSFWSHRGVNPLMALTTHRLADEDVPEPLDCERLQPKWQGILERRFDGAELFRFWKELWPHLPAGSVIREIGRVCHQDARSEFSTRSPVVFEYAGEWRATTRIDGVLPLRIPLASDLLFVGRSFAIAADTLGFRGVETKTFQRLEEDVAICLLSWLHGRELRVDYEIDLQMRVACPRSSLGAREQLCVLITLPNGRRTTVFCTPLRGDQWLSIPNAAVEHVELLGALREAGRGARLRLEKLA